MTKSTLPISMPSSRLLVATTQRSRPCLRSSSMRLRRSLDTDPWWAMAMVSSGACGWMRFVDGPAMGWKCR